MVEPQFQNHSTRERESFAQSWTIPASLLFMVVVLGYAVIDESVSVALYLVSFWHYYLYWLALAFRSVPLRVFKRDAVLLKIVAMAALAWAYLSGTPDPVSLAVVVVGFLLNIQAAALLGSERTYYGVEISGLKAETVTKFPYSLTAHPMLYGNMTAFAGMLLNAEFRTEWWPLAVAHVTFNFSLLLLETRGTPIPPRLGSRHTAWIALGATAAGACLGYALALASGANDGDFSMTAGLGAAAAGYATCLYFFYSAAAPLSAGKIQR